MQTDWTIRDEFIYLSQRWPYLLLAFLAGSLLGWGLARLLPAAYEAQTRWSVAINADAEPRNPDDFKNWQLQQLEAFLLSEAVLAETAARLNGMDVETLASQVETRWRNTGQWTLAARGGSAEEARTVVAAWSAAGQEQLAAAAGYAQEMLSLERSLRQTRNDLSLVQGRLAVLQQAGDALGIFQAALQNRPEAEPLPELERWNLALIAGQALADDPAAASLLAQMPPPQAPASEYPAFIALVQAGLEQQLSRQDARETALQTAYEEFTAAWQTAEQAAHGLSAYLAVEPLQQGAISAAARQNTGMAALVGGLVGLLVFFGFRLAVRSR
jgi:hypothetical protein